jgi:hypothetical protein
MLTLSWYRGEANTAEISSVPFQDKVVNNDHIIKREDGWEGLAIK